MVQKDVARFDIRVDHIVGMQEIQPGGEIGRETGKDGNQLQMSFDFSPLLELADQGFQRSAEHGFEDQTLVAGVEAVEGNDEMLRLFRVGPLKPGENQSFLTEHGLCIWS